LSQHTGVKINILKKMYSTFLLQKSFS